MILHQKFRTLGWLERQWMRKADTFRHASWELSGKNSFRLVVLLEVLLDLTLPDTVKNQAEVMVVNIVVTILT